MVDFFHATEKPGLAATWSKAHAVTGGGGVLRRLGLLPSSAGSPTSVVVPLRAPLWFQFDALHDAASKGRLAARKIRRAEAAQRTHVAAPDVDSVEPEADLSLIHI